MRKYIIDPDNEDRIIKIPSEIIESVKKEERNRLRDKLCGMPIRDDRWKNCDLKMNPNCEICHFLGLV